MKKLLLFLLMVVPVGAADKYSSGKTKEHKTPKYSSGSKPEEHKPKFNSGKTKVEEQPKVKPKYGSGKTDGHKPEEHKTKPDVGTKPRSDYDRNAADAQRRAEGKKIYDRGHAPAPTYVDKSGKTRHIDPNDSRVKRLRDQLSHERYENRRLREERFFGGYASRPIVVYHDPYSSFFWWWLLDRSIEQQALWAYHHRSSMDEARYRDLISRNAELAARVRALEAARTPLNADYKPSGMEDEDLMYDSEYVNAVYNPTEKHEASASLTPYFIILGILVIILLIWLIFYKEWSRG